MKKQLLASVGIDMKPKKCKVCKADYVPQKMGQRAYGNAINAPAAQAFIECVMQ